MPSYSFKMPRLFVASKLADGDRVTLDKTQVNYLVNVLRLKHGASVLLFNGLEGEWLAQLEPTGKKTADLVVSEQTRAQTPRPRLNYWFAPLKHARLDYMVQKAVEMGVGALMPTLTEHTQSTRLNLDRMQANVIEAAEQCGVISIPDVAEPKSLERRLSDWAEAASDQPVFFCDERADEHIAVQVLGTYQSRTTDKHFSPACLIGPEGGFSPRERDLVLSFDFVEVLPLGPRILRADTAAVAALTLLQAHLGDWR